MGKCVIRWLRRFDCWMWGHLAIDPDRDFCTYCERPARSERTSDDR